MRPLKIALALSVVLTPFVVRPAAAQSDRAAAASEPKLWSTPWDGRPRDPFADQKGNVWFVGQEGNYIARLDPKTGEFKRYEIEPGTHPHDLVVDAKGMVWFTGNTNGTIVHLDPATGKLRSIPIPDGVRDPHTMTFDHNGDAWFTAQNAASSASSRPPTARSASGRWNMTPGRTASCSTRRAVPSSICSARTRSARSIRSRASSARTRCRTIARVRAASPSRATTRSGTATTRAATSAASIRGAARWTSGRSRRAGCRCRTR